MSKKGADAAQAAAAVAQDLKCEVLSPLEHDQVRYEAGEICSLPADVAARLAAAGVVRQAE